MPKNSEAATGTQGTSTTRSSGRGGPLGVLSRYLTARMQAAAAEQSALLQQELTRQIEALGERLATAVATETLRNATHLHAQLTEHVSREIAREAAQLREGISQGTAGQAAALGERLGQEIGRQMTHLDTHLAEEVARHATHLDRQVSQEAERQAAGLGERLGQEIGRQMAHLDTHLTQELERHAAPPGGGGALAALEARLAEAAAQNQGALLQDLHRHMSHVDAHLSEHLTRQLALQFGGGGTGRSWRSRPEELQQRLLTLGRLMRPAAAQGVGKRRVGHGADGGYVLLDDFDAVAFALSFGVGQEITWDLELAERGIAVHQFDHTIEQPPGTHPRLHFHRSRIAPLPEPGAESLRSAQQLGGGGRCIVKMDIEGDEWRVLEAAAAGDFAQITQFICEFHDFDRVDDPEWFNRAQGVLTALEKAFRVVHVHANNHGALLCAGNVAFPEILEVTFANRAFYQFAEGQESFPTALDAPNRPDLPDIVLGAFRF